VGDLLGFGLKPATDGWEQACYVHVDESVDIRLGYHSLDNDRDMFFERYRYQIDIHSLQEDKVVQEQFGRSAFQKLKWTQKYALLLVYDLQVKLDEYDPT
jgi:hypothetical protein